MRTGLTFGVFDLLHVGHIHLLREARSQCDRLLVGVTTDECASTRKGRAPVIPFRQRRILLETLLPVTATFKQDETFTKRDAVAAFQPDVIFVGDDWNPSTFEGENLGVPVVYIPRLPEWSTTRVRRDAGS